MRILLDTHIFIWVLNDDPHLSNKTWSVIENAEKVFVSSASIWEATIKYQLGKLSIDPDKLVSAVSLSGFIELPISMHHAATVKQLPLHHRDPFDRLLIAQAMSEPMHLLSEDTEIKKYAEYVHLIFPSE